MSAVQLFLTMVYRSKQTQLWKRNMTILVEVARLADQLDAPGILSALDVALAAMYGSRTWYGGIKCWELLRLADRQADKVPLTYQVILSRAERTLRDGDKADVRALLEGKKLEGLSSKMLSDLIRKLHKY